MVYINDLPDCIQHSTCLLFADYTKLIKSIHDVNDVALLQDDLNALDIWCKKWNIGLNVAKCKTMRLAFKQNKQIETSQYSVQGNLIEQVSSHCDLGISVTQDLSWTYHHSRICKKAYMSLNLIRRVIPANSSTNLKKKLYLSLVRSHFSFCSQLAAEIIPGSRKSATQS